MMAEQNGTNGSETISGQVEATNDKGIKLGGGWFNYSQYAHVPRPLRGQAVQLQVKGRFIKPLAVLDNGSADQGATEGHQTPTVGSRRPIAGRAARRTKPGCSSRFTSAVRRATLSSSAPLA